MNALVHSRVHWTEGMLLAPQHLQQTDLFHSESLVSMIQTLFPELYGVAELCLDEELLGEGIVRIQHFSGVLPDGMLLRFDQEAQVPPAGRCVQQHFRAEQQVLEVFLAVRRANCVGPAASAGPECDTRFRILQRTVSDTSASDDAVELSCQFPNPRILFGDEERGSYCSIKIAEVTRKEDGAFAYVENYIPRILRIGASAYLTGCLRQLNHKLAARGKGLRDRFRERQFRPTEGSFEDPATLLLMRSLCTAESLLVRTLERPSCHPEDLFQGLHLLAGELAPILNLEPTELPRFNPDHLRECLIPLLEIVAGAATVPERECCLRLPLEAREDGVHFGELNDDGWLTCTQYFVGVRCALEESQVAHEFPRLAKIAGWSGLEGILAAATPGVSAKLCLTPPGEIPTRSGTVYFRLDSESPLWPQLLGEQRMAVYLPSPFQPSQTQLELIATASSGSPLEAGVRGVGACIPVPVAKFPDRTELEESSSGVPRTRVGMARPRQH